MSTRFIYAERSDGTKAIVNLAEVWYIAFRDDPNKPQLYFKFGKDETFTVKPEMAHDVWESVEHLQGSGGF
jgi:hypothetical protein